MITDKQKQILNKIKQKRKLKPISLKDAEEKFKQIQEEGGFSHFIVHKRRWFEVFFIIAFIICMIQSFFVKVNYDLTEYLPDSVTSKKAINVMEQEFGYPGTARIMIKDVSIYDAYMYKQKIENVDGVDMVNWMTQDVYMAQDFMDMDAEEDYYKDRCAVMDITFDEGDTAELTKSAITKIQSILGEQGRYSGPAIENKSLEETLTKEIRVIMIVAVIMILAILCLTTTSWFEPILFLSIMGIAIMLNQGTNLILGTISFLSSSVSNVLQLATSMDYSIFLLHTYIRINKTVTDKKIAMARAVKESAVSILSSAMTTFMGFMALLCMRYKIGADVGIVLGKSIICSVVTVIFLMPALILRFSDLIAKTQHKNMIPEFNRLFRGIYKMRAVVVIFLILVVSPAYVAQNMNHFTFGNSALGRSQGTKVYADTAEIEEKFGRSNLYLVMVPNETPIKERNMCDDLDDLYYVKSVTGLANVLPMGVPESIVPDSIKDQLRTEHYARILVYTRTAAESDLAFQSSDEIQSIVKNYYPENSYIAGGTPSTQDLKEICLSDNTLVNALSLLGVALVVAVAFNSLLLPVLVLIPINIATYMNMAVSYLEGDSFMFFGYIVVSCIQLGATVDYSILLTNNYVDNRSVGMEKKEAALDALKRSFLSIITSGTILTVAGYGIYFIASVSAISSIGHMIGRGGFLSMCMVLVCIPTLLTIFDPLIFKERNKVMKWKEKHRQRIRQKIMNKVKGGKKDA